MDMFPYIEVVYYKGTCMTHPQSIKRGKWIYQRRSRINSYNCPTQLAIKYSELDSISLFVDICPNNSRCWFSGETSNLL